MKKKFFLHFLFALFLLLLLTWGVFSMLDRYTRHGEVYIVPDFSGLNHQEVISQYEDQFRFIIADSIYEKGMIHGAVLQQDPLPGSKVKKGRNLYIIVVAKQPDKVMMPNLANLSLRQALVTLESAGLNINELSFTEHFARNAVVSQLHNGMPIEPGTELFRGSSIDIVLGDGGNLLKVPFPMIFGKKPTEARQILRYATLNVGNEYFVDGNDTVNSRVYKIQPYVLPGTDLLPGTYITIWYRSDEMVNFEDFLSDSLYIEEFKEDSINSELNEEEIL
jgi:eukaryotic-like serine/threonine-protein kinase